MEIIKITEDKRGAIYLVKDLLEGEKEYTFMEIKSGYARGGCVHSNAEFFAVICGKVKFLEGENEKTLGAGDSGKIEPGTPHAFVAIENSIVSEWGITTREKTSDVKDNKMRAFVDAINNAK